VIECKKCKALKDEEAFSFRNKKKLQRHSACKDCTRVISTEWYNNNKTRHGATSKTAHKKWRAKMKREAVAVVNEIKKGPCLDCKQTFNPWQMQFDHLDPSTKKFNIASAVHVAYMIKLPEILAEIAKCELVCANCHATRTHNRRKGLES
jgi:hypothetical protein